MCLVNFRNTKYEMDGLMENAIEMDDLGGKSPLFGNIQMKV